MEPHIDRDRLVKLLARLDSDSDAEVLAAAKLAMRHLRDHGKGWDDVVSGQDGRGFKSWLNGWTRLASETRRRIAAERAAEQWQSIARRFEEEVSALRRPMPQQPAAPKAAANDRSAAKIDRTGHEMIDRLLAAPGLDALARARVEAIASWFRRTHELTGAELADLEQFSRSVAA